MQEMTMVERVACSIAQAETGSAENWKSFKYTARVAIEALREPSPLMQRRIAEAGVHPNVHRSLMRSLIDAALEETPCPTPK